MSYNSFVLSERLRDFKASTCFSVYFSKVLPKGEYANLACFIIRLRLQGNMASPASYLSIWPDDNADTCVASLLIAYCRLQFFIFNLIINCHY